MTDALPTEKDFGDSLDAQLAWKHFGGMNLEEATRKFRENPFHYQEDFMWMGEKAFDFYFPVIDSYLRETPIDAWDDREAYILAQGIMFQFQGDLLEPPPQVVPQILNLADYVLSNIRLFAADNPAGQERIATAWRELKDQIGKHASL